MEAKEKLSVLLKHWIEHNESHGAEYKKWAKSAGEQGLNTVRDQIEKAIENLNQCNRSLQEALKEL